MTIRKGEPWGEPVARPDGLVRHGSDAELAAALAGDPDHDAGVAAGDLHRAIGGPPDRADMQRLPIDAMTVVVDEEEFHAVANVVAKLSWWRGPIVVVTNVGQLGPWHIAPRAHPNDGRLHVVTVDASMTLRERWQARSRLPTGTHVPHPRIEIRSTDAVDETFERPLDIVVDGRTVGRATRLRVEIVPDAHTIVV